LNFIEGRIEGDVLFQGTLSGPFSVSEATPIKTQQVLLQLEKAMDDAMNTTNNIELAAEIVSAYVSNNSVPAVDLPSLINEVYNALLRVGSGTPAAPAEAPKPAVAVKKSVTNDHIICLEDGKKFKSLKRHLRTQYGLSPEDYREKWGLAPDYPMVAPNYAKARSNLAKQMGLGQQRRRRISK
jgi:predicted transcriptional regulator